MQPSGADTDEFDGPDAVASRSSALDSAVAVGHSALPQACSTPIVHSFAARSAVVALWEAFYIENKRFDLDTLMVPNRPPTPISKSNEFL